MTEIFINLTVMIIFASTNRTQLSFFVMDIIVQTVLYADGAGALRVGAGEPERARPGRGGEPRVSLRGDQGGQRHRGGLGRVTQCGGGVT